MMKIMLVVFAQQHNDFQIMLMIMSENNVDNDDNLKIMLTIKIQVVLAQTTQQLGFRMKIVILCPILTQTSPGNVSKTQRRCSQR